jgi:hypothetical protein
MMRTEVIILPSQRLHPWSGTGVRDRWLAARAQDLALSSSVTAVLEHVGSVHHFLDGPVQFDPTQPSIAVARHGR